MDTVRHFVAFARRCNKAALHARTPADRAKLRTARDLAITYARDL